jgi:asparagine synthase (glutamine-hydrolysing)
MCGITGFWLSGDTSRSALDLFNVVERMADAIRLRGPDDAGTWDDAASGIALGHRRLAVVDLSPAGHQPMSSSTGRFVIAFNGEIYNHLKLRNELKDLGVIPNWKSHSDTETLLVAIEHWGVEVALQHCVGMFAIALWDKQNCTLTLVRDRMGEKPLYYGWAGTGSERAFIFASELKALKAYTSFDAPVCRQALSQYLRFMYVPSPRSIYQGIFKLEPGCMLTVKDRPPADAPIHPLRPGQVQGNLALQRWWSLSSAVKAGVCNPIADEAEALSQLEENLTEAVSIQSLADVPLGAFLSGGVDSSTIVALMQRQSIRPVKTFTIGFEEAGFDESPYAHAVAEHLGTDHHEMRVNSKMAQDVIPGLPDIYDEPFADSSQIPTYLVSKLARQQVTVALSGDAGDELFGGYNRYFVAPPLWQKLNYLPFEARKIFGKCLGFIPTNAWDTAGVKLFRGSNRFVRLGEKVHNMAERLSYVKDFEGLELSLVSTWANPSSLVKGKSGAMVIEPSSLLDDPLPIPEMDLPLPMMYRDSMTYLPDDILCKVDRAAMACSLETRVPFLDHKVVELAWRLPLHMKVRGNTGKWALRQVLYKYVPKKLIERPKAGFAIPIGQWLSGPLRDWAEALLSEQRLEQEGYFHSGPIRQAWAEQLAGTRDNTAKLWAVLMFQAWLEKNR